MVPVSLIFAMARNRAIGHKGDLPWHIPGDLQRFRALTSGHPCIMGRKTCESIIKRLGKPLPGRPSIVISRSGYTYPGVTVVSNIESSLDVAQSMSPTEIFVIGGADIYALALPWASRLYITEVDLKPDADAFMPVWDETAFTLTYQEDHAGSPTYRFLDYVRRDINDAKPAAIS
jgi:dihydrofolate reductase